MTPGDVSSRHNRTDLFMIAQKLQHHARCLNMSKPDRVPVLREGSGHRVPPQSQRYLQPIPAGKGKTGFLQQSFPRYNNHNSGQDSCPGEVAQCKRNTTIFLCTFSFSVFWHSFVVLIFCLFVLILVSVLCRIYLLIFVFSCVFIFVPCGFCSFACLLLKESTHQVGWGGSGKN